MTKTTMRLCDGWRELTKRQDAILRALRAAALDGNRGLSIDDLRPADDKYPKAHIRALKDLESRDLIVHVWGDNDVDGCFVLKRAGWACFDETRPTAYYPPSVERSRWVRL